jgi:hypothetical protein
MNIKQVAAGLGELFAWDAATRGPWAANKLSYSSFLQFFLTVKAS